MGTLLRKILSRACLAPSALEGGPQQGPPSSSSTGCSSSLVKSFPNANTTTSRSSAASSLAAEAVHYARISCSEPQQHIGLDEKLDVVFEPAAPSPQSLELASLPHQGEEQEEVEGNNLPCSKTSARGAQPVAPRAGSFTCLSFSSCTDSESEDTVKGSLSESGVIRAVELQDLLYDIRPTKLLTVDRWSSSGHHACAVYKGARLITYTSG